MIALTREANTPAYVPDYIARSVADIDFELLKKRGIKHIAFDADSTLVPFRGKEIDQPVWRLLKTNRPLFKRWAIASNRPINDLQPMAKSIGAHVVRSNLISRKPWLHYFAKVFKYLDAKPSEAAMIGDKLIADMWGGKRAGMTTVWVEKIGPDNPLDRIFFVRRIEKWLIKKYLPTEAQ